MPSALDAERRRQTRNTRDMATGETGSLLDWSAFAEMVESPDRTVMLAGCDRFARIVLAQRLRALGYHVLQADDGQAAMEMVGRHHPDVVVCDWNLPRVTGEELCRHIRNDPQTSQTFLILLTPRQSKRKIASALLETGADESLAVPCSTDDLIHRVRAGLRIAELQKLLAQRNDEYRQLTGRLNQELSVVANIQKALLPQKILTHPGIDFTQFYLPSTECGGDYYDLHQLDEDHLGFVIADVSGHGAPAMVAMALIRQDFHLIADRFREPHLLLEELNRMLFDNLPTDQYATMLYAVINPKTLVCSYASAGHSPPVWYRAASGQTARLSNCEGFPLKLVTRDARYLSSSIQLEPKDKLIFYTDGIPECFNSQHELYGMKRFENTIQANAASRTPRQLEMAIVTDVMLFADNHPQEDDLTLAIIGVSG